MSKISRRDFLKGSGAAAITLAVAGLTGCSPKEETTPTPTPVPTQAPAGGDDGDDAPAAPAPGPTAVPAAAPAPAPAARPAAPAVVEIEDANTPLAGPSASPAPSASASPSPSAAPANVYTAIEDIRPGRYLIEYSYYDFDGVSLLTVTRPFVILRDVGDVNVDGVRDAIKAPAAGNSATKNDEYAIEDRVTHDPLGYEAGGWDDTNKKETVYPRANIFKFRVADVNNDRNVNNIDANQAAKNVKDKGGWLRFYDPVEYGHPKAPITAPSPGP